MKISDLEKKLEAFRAEHGDIEVLLEIGSTATGGTFDFDYVDFYEAEEGQYPKDWDMPEGFKFVKMSVCI